MTDWDALLLELAALRRLNAVYHAAACLQLVLMTRRRAKQKRRAIKNVQLQ